MPHTESWSSEAIIADTLCKAPEIDHYPHADQPRFSRWRQFVGSYSLPALPTPMFVVQLAGKSDVRHWDRDGWSEATSFPGAATIVPAGYSTRWLVDGELDVVTFSLGAHMPAGSRLSELKTMRFAYSDPFGAVLAEQILGELYRDPGDAGQGYLDSLTDMLCKHVLFGRSTATRPRYPTSGFSSFRVHKVMNAMIANPGERHSLRELAEQAGITESHLCRVFKQSVGVSPHTYLMTLRLDRARQLLGTSDRPMSHIAELCGFSGASQFTRAFRQHVGETPSNYRARFERGEAGEGEDGRRPH